MGLYMRHYSSFNLFSVCGYIFIGISSIIPTAMVILGAKYQDHCPKEDMIPIFLMTLGACSLIIVVLNVLSQLLTRCTFRQENDGIGPVRVPWWEMMAALVNWLIQLFLAIWFVAGRFFGSPRVFQLLPCPRFFLQAVRGYLEPINRIWTRNTLGEL